ncbi:ATP-binding protein [Geobacter sp.]|uniref:AAA family ATPase n=1 Tax=Geobacter sp. TaxID=46610 RepID=UPI00260B604A|nr:ATP-binding protein [Geobacter sp.]
MPGTAGTDPAEEIVSYADGLEQLTDELRRLDLLIRSRALVVRGRGERSQAAPFKGLVISDEEIDELLLRPSPDASDHFVRLPRHGAGRPTELERIDGTIAARRAATRLSGLALPLLRLSHLFRLTPFEEQCLIVALAPELDGKYEKLYAYLNDDVTRRLPTVGLVLDLLCATLRERIEARRFFDPRAPLLRYRLLRFADPPDNAASSLISRPLRTDERIAGFLLGAPPGDPRLGRAASLEQPREGLDLITLPAGEVERLRRVAADHFRDPARSDRNLVFHFHGPPGVGKKGLVSALCADLGTALVTADLRKLADGPLPFEEAALLLCREVALHPAALCLEECDFLWEDDGERQRRESLAEAVTTFSRLTFFLGSKPWRPDGLFKDELFVPIPFPVPGDADRKEFWAKELARVGDPAHGIDVEMLAGAFRLTPGQMRHVLADAADRARVRSGEGEGISADDLLTACRSLSTPKFGGVARTVKPSFGWNDIVLPADQRAQLEEICARARHRHLVIGAWGFGRKLAYGTGQNVLFSGPSGTGKTMAAQVVATELGLALFRIDLSQVVSKYIGETEKNLDRIFTAAEAGSAILFFDEADALFGKRSEVKDAHDRYANIEIGYLLQKMEEYEGIAILATNLRANMDEAFVRRMQAIVEFPFPDEAQRRRIWEVVIPDRVPLGDDVDFGLLAREVRLAGGNIRNIALAAAFCAAADGGSVTMGHLMQAVRREYQKLGRTWDGMEQGDEP